MPHPRQPDAHQLQERRAVGARIRAFREQAGLTQERLGEAIGRDRRTVLSYEHGYTSAPLDELTAMARALGVETWRLFYG